MIKLVTLGWGQRSITITFLRELGDLRWRAIECVVVEMLTEKHFTDHTLHMYKQEQTVKSMDHSQYLKSLLRKITMQGLIFTAISDAEKHIILTDVT